MSVPNLFKTVRRSRYVLPVAVAIAIAFLVLNEGSYQRAIDTISVNQEVLDGRIEVRRLQLMMLAAETGQRGYLLTGNKEFLAPYQSATGAIEKQLAKLETLYGQRPEWRDDFNELLRLTRAKLGELSTTIELQDRGRSAAALELVNSGIGLEDMRALEKLIGTIAFSQQGRMENNAAVLKRTLNVNRVGLAALVALSVVGLSIYLRQARRLERFRSDEQVKLQGERDLLEEQVTRRTSQLTELARHLQSIREEERSHVARELHDELGALLTAAKLDLARVRSKLKASPVDVVERLDHMNDTLNQGVALKRRIIEDLRPSTLANLGLSAALEILCRDFAQRSEIEVVTSLAEVKLSADSQLTIYRLVQEALTNVAKYARARRVEVTLRSEESAATIAVRDDGYGFVVEAVRLGAHGLAGMRFRVESAGGAFEVLSSPRGTTLQARLPEDATLSSLPVSSV